MDLAYANVWTLHEKPNRVGNKQQSLHKKKGDTSCEVPPCAV